MTHSRTFPTFPEARDFMARQAGDCSMVAGAGRFVVRYRPARMLRINK